MHVELGGLTGADWNYDGIDDLIVTDRNGFISYLERKGEYPNISFEDKGFLRDDEKGLYFNVPWDNPNLKEMDCLGGYVDVGFFNYLYPIKYDFGDSKACNLIIGDLSGNLWWIPDVSPGTKGPSKYKGIPHSKDPNKVFTAIGKKTIEQYGTEYVKPMHKICDEKGEPFLLGDMFENGKLYNGGNVRPAIYKNKITGMDDLLILAGQKKSEILLFTKS